MRCHDARNRMTELHEMNLSSASDPELEKHIRNCPSCAQYAYATKKLERFLCQAAISDDVDVVPWCTLKKQVEVAATAIRYRTSGRIFSLRRVRTILGKPRYSVSLALAMGVLILCTAIPMKWQRTVGYEVAFAGVDKSLAFNSSRVTELLEALGCGGATIDVQDGESTCRLRISDLKSKGDVQLVVAAFDRLGNCALEDVEEIQEGESGSLLTRAKHVMSSGISEFEDQEEVQKIVVNCISALKSESCSTFTVWTCMDSTLQFDCDTLANSGGFIQGTNCEDILQMGIPQGEGLMKTVIGKSDGRGMVFHIRDSNGEERLFDLDESTFNEQLQAMGLNGSMCNKGDSICTIICAKLDSSNCQYIADSSEGLLGIEQETAALPEGFELAQNVPNPFNPSTSIEFNLPATQNVTLRIFNINGQLVRTLVDEELTAGPHSVVWDATTDSGEKVSSGVYLYRLTAGDYVQTRKMSFVK